jgi:hypothetical protein
VETAGVHTGADSGLGTGVVAGTGVIRVVVRPRIPIDDSGPDGRRRRSDEKPDQQDSAHERQVVEQRLGASGITGGHTQTGQEGSGDHPREHRLAPLPPGLSEALMTRRSVGRVHRLRVLHTACEAPIRPPDEVVAVGNGAPEVDGRKRVDLACHCSAVEANGGENEQRDVRNGQADQQRQPPAGPVQQITGG